MMDWIDNQLKPFLHCPDPDSAARVCISRFGLVHISLRLAWHSEPIKNIYRPRSSVLSKISFLFLFFFLKKKKTFSPFCPFSSIRLVSLCLFYLFLIILLLHGIFLRVIIIPNNDSWLVHTVALERATRDNQLRNIHTITIRYTGLKSTSNGASWL